jgi:hypothetical protein
VGHHVRMTVGKLRELTAGLDDNMPILVPSGSHSYRPAVAHDMIAVLDPDWGWSEDFGDSNPDEVSEEMRKRVLLVSGE